MPDDALIDHHAALIYVMVLVSGSDRHMTDAELRSIGEIVNHLPVFRDYDKDRLTSDAADCAEVLSGEEGLETVFRMVKEALPQKLHETAYALACDVAAADGKVEPEELRLLEMVRWHLAVGRLPAAAIERAARARHQRL